MDLAGDVLLTCTQVGAHERILIYANLDGKEESPNVCALFREVVFGGVRLAIELREHPTEQSITCVTHRHGAHLIRRFASSLGSSAASSRRYRRERSAATSSSTSLRILITTFVRRVVAFPLSCLSR